ncbi:MAG: sigma factor-like helix-turn-helix DNA-binding protein [Candidatus Onthomonas sp.]
MSKPTYRCGKSKADRIRQIIIYVNRHDLDSTLDQYTLAVIQELRRKLTERELQCLTGYYIQQTALAELGPKLGINPSTVCRNIHRGEEKLWQVVDLADKISPFRLPEILQNRAPVV